MKLCGGGHIYIRTTSARERKVYSMHSYDITKYSDKKQTFLVKHFNLSDHSIDDFGFQIIGVIDGADTRQKLLAIEEFWIRTLVTAYPYGLNDNVSGYGNISDGLLPFNSKNNHILMHVFPEDLGSMG